MIRAGLRPAENPGLFADGRGRLSLGLVLTIAVVAFEGLAVATIMPITALALRGLALYAWSFSGFMLGRLVGTVAVGEYAERHGPALPLKGALAVFSCGLLACGAARTMPVSRRGIDATSMRDIADAAGVREAAIYRHFAGKDDLAREIFLSWYGWYCEKLQSIVSGPAGTLDKLREIVRHEFSAVTDHSEAFVYFCENEARFVRSLPSEIVSARRVFTTFIKAGQADGDVRAGSADLLADMLSGALCAVALTWLRAGRRKKLNMHLEEVVQGCWRMIAT